MSIDKLLSGYSMETLLTTLGVMKTIEHKFSIEEFKSYIARQFEHLVEANINQNLDLIVLPSCPVCSSRRSLLALNVPKGTRNLYGYKSILQCPCGFEEFSLLSVTEYIKNLKEDK